MKRNVLSTLSGMTAAALLICSTLTASANSVLEPDLLNYKNEPAYISDQGVFNGIMVETDGTELTEEMVDDLNGFTSLMTWEEYCAFQFNHESVTDITPEGTAYMIELDSADADYQVETGRNLMLKIDGVKNVYVVHYTTYTYFTPSPQLFLRLSGSDVTVDDTLIPELAGYEIEMVENGCWCTLPDTENLEGIETQYDLYVYFRDLGRLLLEKYGDIVTYADQGMYILEGPGSSNTVGTPTSIWQTAGDPNADGAVDAKDAAAILQTAAENGTGAGIAATSATDVNADGEVNAKDAAAVLVYAAEAGTGKTPDWVEILRRR